MKIAQFLLLALFLFSTLTFAQRDEVEKTEKEKKGQGDSFNQKNNDKRDQKDDKKEKDQRKEEDGKNQKDKDEPSEEDILRKKVDIGLLKFFQKNEAGKTKRVVVRLVNVPGVTFRKCLKKDLNFLKSTIKSTQEKFLKELPTGMFKPATFITLQYSIAGHTDLNGVRFMAALDSVACIVEDHKKDPYWVEGKALMGVTEVNSTRGFDGTGITVATIDGALRTTHSWFSGAKQPIDSYDFSNGDSNVYPSPISADASYHGSGVYGIVAKIATGSKQVHYQVFNNAYDSTIANAINRCITKNSDGISPAIRVISMSLGGGRYYSPISGFDTIGEACADAVTADILCFAASGNDGWTNSMGSPAAHPSCISVSSVVDATGASYSPFPPAYSSQPSSEKVEGYWWHYADVATFLDLYAPSEEVITANENGGTSPLGGTSSATPEAAAGTAVLLQALPSLKGDQAGLVSLYQSTGASVPNAPVTGAARLLKVNLALDSVLGPVGGGTTPPPGGGGTTPPPSGGPAEISNGGSVSGSVAQGEWAQFFVTIPAGASSLTIAMNGNGDADLYVKKGSEPTTSSWDFRPYVGGSAETVTVSGATSPVLSSGVWNIGVRGYSSGNSDFDLVVNYTTSGGGTTPPPEPEPEPEPIGLTEEVEPNNSRSTSNSNLVPTPNVPIDGWVSSSDKNDYFRVEISGTTNFDIELDVPSGTDYDLYLYKGNSKKKSSLLGGSATENISYAGSSGTYYIRVYRYSGSSSTPYSLTINWD